MKMTEHYRGLISAPTKEEARELLLLLASNKLVAGGLISEGFSTYWWEGELVDKIYFNISVFTTKNLKKEVIEVVKNVHSDEVPIIAFFKIADANHEFLTWISENVQN